MFVDDFTAPGQGPGSVRERSQLPDLQSGTVSLNISVLPSTSTVLNVASRLIILTFILIFLRLFIFPYWLCNAWLFRLVVGREINNFNNNNNNNNSGCCAVSRCCTCGLRRCALASKWWRNGISRGRSCVVLAGYRSSVNSGACSGLLPHVVQKVRHMTHSTTR